MASSSASGTLPPGWHGSTSTFGNGGFGANDMAAPNLGPVDELLAAPGPETAGMAPTIQALTGQPQFVNLCAFTKSQIYNSAVRAQLAAAGTFATENIDVSNFTTSGETPFEAGLRAQVARQAARPSPLFTATVAAHTSNADQESLIKLYSAVVVGADGSITSSGAPVQTTGEPEQLYLLMSFLKYFVYGETNDVTRDFIQRVHMFLFIYLAAIYLTFSSAGAALPMTDGQSPTPEASPLLDLINASTAEETDRGNGVLSNVSKIDPDGLAKQSSKLRNMVIMQQMSLTRATVGIDDATAQRRSEIIQLCGFLALAAASTGVFYGWMHFRPELWHRMRVPMATVALATAVIVLSVTAFAILRPVERFEQSYEGFCDQNGKCEAAMEDWSRHAASKTYISTLDKNATLTSKVLKSRDDALRADLTAVSRRVNATDLMYRDALFSFNQVRQAKRFVVMTLAVALLLMVLVILGVPTRLWVGLHVAAAVIILVVAVLVYRGNSQRFRRDWGKTYWPQPDNA